jgi:trans-aconitate methyltransferase
MNERAGGEPPASPGATREWNADVYHRVSDPQRAWGGPVLARLPLAGTELVLDVGCGTGRLTAEMLQRLPRGHAIAVDLSENMLITAERHLVPAFSSRITFVRADAAALPFAGVADAVFSTATFHWVRNHDRLFASLFTALKPGGRLVAQCGGAGNLRRMHGRCETLMRDKRFAPYFQRWEDPWEFADTATATARLLRAGFIDVRTSLEPAPIVQPTRAAFVEFVSHVICRPHLARLADPSDRDAFMDALATLAAADTPAFELDYWRLNIEARKPEMHSAKCQALSAK